MSRNGAGTFEVLNPILVGALRSSTAVNTNFTDAGDEITNTMPLTGVAAMSGQFKAVVLGSGAPGITWADDTNTGFRRTGSDAMAWVGGGEDRATMDANGKLTLAGGLDVAGAFTHTTGFSPQTLAGTGAARATLRCTGNDTDEHVLAKYQSGSGVGAIGELRMVGAGANDVATMRFYVNSVLAFQWTSALFTHSLDTLFGASGIRADTDGYLDFPEITAPSAPASNIARLYSKDDSGTTKLYFKDSAGTELPLQSPTDRQVFTASDTWTKPTAGQRFAMIEMWGGGASGGKNSSANGAAGGGGGAYSRRVIALASLSASVSVTVASGGASQTSANSAGNAGGNSNFGTYIKAWGGGAGDGTSANNTEGGGGGGFLSAGGDGSLFDGQGGSPGGVDETLTPLLGSEGWGVAGISTINSNPFGGAAAGFGDGSAGEASLFGGGGGGSGADDASAGLGGASVFGGGGGGGAADTSGSFFGGSSVFGGDGGRGQSDSSAVASGSVPAGGGGGSTSSNSGAGARGEVRVTCW